MRVRFAPSPTGNLHIGSVRTALFNWVFAQHHNATCVLRIEDTDLARSESQYEDNIIEGLDWLGLSMDEGPSTPKNGMSYRQSERIKEGVYQKYADQLIASKRAYYCFATEAELDAERESAKARGEAYVYSGKSRHLSEQEVREKLDNGVPYTLRFYLGAPQDIVVKDLIRGDITFDTSLLSDFVIMKSDGSPAYNFAVVVDDVDMKISHVIRGEDHISNTPRQILVYQALGATVPEFAHLPIILGKDKSKLSKRDGAMAVTDYRELGYIPDALINYLSLLGWSPADGREILSRDNLVSQFDLGRISKSGAVFDEAKLKWMNGQYIRALDAPDLLAAVTPYFTDETSAALANYSDDVKAAMVYSVKDNLELLPEINQYLDLYMMDDVAFKARLAEIDFTDDNRRVLQLFSDKLAVTACQPDDVETAMNAVCEELELGKGKVFKPIRLATTTFGSGPHLPECLSIFGLDDVLKRLSYTLEG